MRADLVTDCEGTFATLRGVFPGIDSDAAWWVPINCALIRTDGATVLVDTGVGLAADGFMPGVTPRLLDELATAGVSPEQVDVVVHTHLHIDHVGWDGSFPNARYVVHDDDWTYFMTDESLAERPHLRERVLPLERVERVRGAAEVVPGVHVEPAPGHTPGHMIVRAGGVAVVGDLAAHELQLADPDFVFVNDMDPHQAAATRRRVLAELAAEGADVLSGHFRGRGRFERAGKGFRWAVE